MRLASFSIVALSLAAIMAGCSSNTDVSGGGGTGSTPQPYKPNPNGKSMNEAEACQTLFDSIMAQGQKLGCTLTKPTCPGYIQSAVPGAEACLLYDQGTILGCKDFYSSFTSCDDFANRPCIIAYFKGSAPQGCPPKDAGADVTPSDGGLDATPQDDVVPQDDATPQDDVVPQDDAAPQDDVVPQDDAAPAEDASTD